MNEEHQSQNDTTSISSSRQNPPESVPQKSKGHFWKEVIIFTVVALVIVLPIRFFVAQPFIVSGDSMDPTFATGQYLIVNELSYHFSNPQRGQVIIFKYPKDTTKYFIKRIIGLPGETVVLSGTSVTIKNAANPNGFTLNEPYVIPQNQMENNETITLSNDEYFVMGDNRRESSDSRAWGPVPRNLIIGTPVVRLFPLNTISAEPGNYQEPK